MILTVDIGNSRIKWAQWQTEVIVARGVAAYSADTVATAFDQLFFSAESAVEPPSQVLAVCVASDDVRQVLSDWVRQHWQLDVQYLKTEKQYQNIINAYENPEHHGADRWAGIIAGFQSFPDSAVCVIGAGTAITFDLINSDGQHLGGYILPSYVTMHTALMGDTANVVSIVNVQFNKNKNIPDNTDDAVNEGLHRLLQSGIRELCRFAQEMVDGPMQIIITGGFAKTILSYPDMPAMHHKPDLVMQGLYDIMKQQKTGLVR
jgi:type III pantothenate kinase